MNLGPKSALVMVVVVLASFNGACDGPSQPPKEGAQVRAVSRLSSDLVAELTARITEDSLYSWTTIDRLAFDAWRTTDEYVFVQISEIHNSDDGADPNTQPTVDFWRVDRRTGQWEVEWPAPGEGRISYDLFRSITKDKLDFRWVAQEDPYGAVTIWDQNDKVQPKLIVFSNGEQIYAYDVRGLTNSLGMGPSLGLAYDQLTDRGGRQPKPFDDILGNGLPDLVINEYVLHGGMPESMLTVISLDGTNVVETPAAHCYGEVTYFKDFDGDGCMEIVNTDWEQGFRKFDASGVPLHTYVWQYDSKAGRYRETGTEDPDAPDTWPAYRDKEPDATPPSEP